MTASTTNINNFTFGNLVPRKALLESFKVPFNCNKVSATFLIEAQKVVRLDTPAIALAKRAALRGSSL